MIDHLLTLKEAVDTAKEGGAGSLEPALREQFRARYQQLVDAGYQQNPASEPTTGKPRRGKAKQTKARNLLDRFRDYPDEQRKRHLIRLWLRSKGRVFYNG